VCGSCAVLGYGQGVVTSPNCQCHTAEYRGKSMPRSCQMVDKFSQTSPGRVQGSLVPFWYLDLFDSSFEKQITQLIFEMGLKFRFLNF
jgi:hypothetical protein